MNQISNKCEVIFLAGNHEDRGRNNRKISSCNLGIASKNIIDTDCSPFRHFLVEGRNDVEFLAVPHQSDYKSYTDWTIPQKTAKFRIAIAHATIGDLVYTGPEVEDSKSGIMDSDFFVRFSVDYAALGHIHDARAQRQKDSIIAYSGSARVWRKDESGQRKVNLVKCAEKIEVINLEMVSAGQFRKFTANLSLAGTADLDFARIGSDWGINDWIWIDLKGLVEEPLIAENLVAELKSAFESKVRRLDVNLDIESCAGISTLDITRKFLEGWERKKPSAVGDELEVWKEVRAIGLKKIREIKEAGS